MIKLFSRYFDLYVINFPFMILSPLMPAALPLHAA